MAVTTVALAANRMSYMVARVGAGRMGTFRLGFAPTRAADIDDDQTGRYLWHQTQGPKPLDASLTWTSSQT